MVARWSLRESPVPTDIRGESGVDAGVIAHGAMALRIMAVKNV